MHPPPSEQPPPPAGRGEERRELAVRAWIAVAVATALLVTAGLAAAAGYVLFTVAAVVLAVFAGVEFVWTLRRRG